MNGNTEAETEKVDGKRIRKFSSENGVGLVGSSIRAFRLDIPLKDKLLSISFYLSRLNLKLQIQTKKVDRQERALLGIKNVHNIIKRNFKAIDLIKIQILKYCWPKNIL